MPDHITVRDGKYGPGTHLSITPMEPDFLGTRAVKEIMQVTAIALTIALVLTVTVAAYVMFNPSPYDAFEIRETMQ